jgi:hypothetical protein
MKTRDNKISETPRRVGIWRRGIIENAVIEQNITREEIVGLVNW